MFLSIFRKICPENSKDSLNLPTMTGTVHAADRQWPALYMQQTDNNRHCTCSRPTI